MSGWFRTLFLFSSFGPLYGVLALGLAAQELPRASMAAAVVAVVSLLVFVLLKGGFRSSGVFHDSVHVESQLDENILSYSIAYIPPFLIDNFADLKNIIPAAGFYGTILILMARTETLYVNPYFLLFGYRIYRVRLGSGRRAMLITRRLEIVGGERLNLYEVQTSRLYFAE